MSRAHIVFLDEIARSNEAIRDTLLVAMNERLAQVVGFDPSPLPLLSLFSASNNTFPEEAAAFNDRFLLREIVQPISDDANFLQLLTGQLPDWRTPTATLTLDELRQAQAEVLHVKGTPEVAQAVLTLRAALSQEGVVVSDRRWRQAGKLLKAFGWLQGDTDLDPEHCVCLIHALWTDPKEARVVQQKVYEIACPLSLRAVEIEDQMIEVAGAVPSATDSRFNAKAESALQQIVDGHMLLREEIERSHAKNTARAQKALDVIAGLHKGISTSLFKSVSRLALNA